MAETVTCARCGGAVSMSVLSASVTCPFCRALIQLSHADVAALTRYRTDVQAQLGRAEQERVNAARWEQWYGSSDARKKSNPLIPAAIWLSIVIPLALFGVVAQHLRLSGETIGIVMPVALFTLMAGVIGTYMYWFYSGRRQRAHADALKPASIVCPKCGGPHALGPGEVLERCQFCGAPLMPDERVMEHGRAEADRALVQAEIERSRAERRGMTALSSSSAANAVPYIVLGSFLPITVFGSIGFTISFLLGNERGEPLAGLALLWLFALTNVGLLLAVFVYRRAKQQRLEQLAQGLFARFGGIPLADHWAVNGWLDRHWAGTVPINQMFRGAYYAATAAAIDGYPVLCVMNPVGASEHYPGFVSLRVGVWLPTPERLNLHPALGTARHTLAALGFSLEVVRAGFVALALEKTTAKMSQPLPSGDRSRLHPLLSDCKSTIRVDLPIVRSKVWSGINRSSELR